MISVTILHEAEVELWASVRYYEARSPGLGLDFETQVEASVGALRDFPERWPLRPDGTRRCLTSRFPYVVVYHYSRDHVWVIAIAHCRRRPSYWANRIRKSVQGLPAFPVSKGARAFGLEDVKRLEDEA